MLCCCHLDILNIKQGAPHFHFPLGSTNYIANFDGTNVFGVFGTLDVKLFPQTNHTHTGPSGTVLIRELPLPLPCWLLSGEKNCIRLKGGFESRGRASSASLAFSTAQPPGVAPALAAQSFRLLSVSTPCQNAQGNHTSRWWMIMALEVGKPIKKKSNPMDV